MAFSGVISRKAVKGKPDPGHRLRLREAAFVREARKHDGMTNEEARDLFHWNKSFGVHDTIFKKAMKAMKAMKNNAKVNTVFKKAMKAMKAMKVKPDPGHRLRLREAAFVREARKHDGMTNEEARDLFHWNKTFGVHDTIFKNNAKVNTVFKKAMKAMKAAKQMKVVFTKAKKVMKAPMVCKK